ncbi:MurR/RpiR family transcriptional regulator [Lacrimispora algidixylanolytica]|uniref:RpiR family transcriptional regulator n=1 Tax=Lacrimispora algidixylanolytica TaxID=94868 RepID=A0A419SU22_9FIRM|nr:MurR/RpiR family transcriptional regulator [Lacrimispora algidixylanolytica]RKD28729.1 RpiR family transcriptional regulator [Lacrimispora algidixylanolytica]
MQENISVSGVLCSSYDSFFEAEKKIADYILAHKSEMIDMTVAELALASGTSDATVSRFCRRCGFNGFHHLKINLAKEIAEERGNSVEVSNDISRENLSQSLQNILANKIAELTQTITMMDTEELERILTVIESAKTVQLVAVGNTIPVAMDGSFKFNQLGIAAVSGTIWETQMAFTCNLKEGDAVIIISNSGFSKRLMTLAAVAKENHTPIIAITNNPSSPLGQVCDYHITTATREKLLLGEFCFSRVSATTVIEILYLLLSVSKKDSHDHIRRHELSIYEDKK